MNIWLKIRSFQREVLGKSIQTPQMNWIVWMTKLSHSCSNEFQLNCWSHGAKVKKQSKFYLPREKQCNWKQDFDMDLEIMIKFWPGAHMERVLIWVLDKNRENKGHLRNNIMHSVTRGMAIGRDKTVVRHSS